MFGEKLLNVNPGVISESGTSHANHDLIRVKRPADGSLVALMIDGSGGSLNDKHWLHREEKDGIIRGTVRSMADAGFPVLESGDTREAIQAAHQSGMAQEAYGTGTAVVVGKPDSNFRRAVDCSHVGDSPLIIFDPRCPFPNKRAYEPGVHTPCNFQLVTKPQHMAEAGRAMGGSLRVDTIGMERSAAANRLTDPLGDKKLPSPEILDSHVVLEGHQLVLLASDGIRAGDLISMDESGEYSFMHAQRIHDVLLNVCAGITSPKEAVTQIKDILRYRVGETDDISILIVPPCFVTS